MKIIILDDAFRMTALWKEALEARGHDCVTFIWVPNITDGQLTGHNQDKVHHTVNLQDFDLALVDGFLAIPGLMGWDIIPHLTAAGVPAVTTSSHGPIGGILDVEKEDVVGRLDEILSYARKPQSKATA